MKLRLGTRGSDLALTQSRWVASQLAEAGVTAELVIISTSGDRSTAPTFGAIGPQGVFVREIEQALVDGSVDFAVHSFKDLPTTSPDGLVVAAVPPRRDPADWLLYRKPASTTGNGGSASATHRASTIPGAAPDASTLPALAALPAQSRMGTASARRQSWLKHLRPDLAVTSLRGNVPTRLKRLASGDFDAILLAGAGIERLAEASDVLDVSLASIERARLEPTRFVPAPAQGALAIQCRADDSDVCAALAAIDDAGTRVAVTLERAALAIAEGGCDTAFGAYALPGADRVELRVMTERDGVLLRACVAGATDDAALAARAIAALAPTGSAG